MKCKMIIVAACSLGMAASSLMANTASGLSSDVKGVQLRLERVQKINNLQAENKQLKMQLDKVNKALADTKYRLGQKLEQVKADAVNIQNLEANNKTLAQLKSQLEQNDIENQKNLSASYNKNLAEQQSNEQDKINDMLQQFTSSKESLENKVAALEATIQKRDKTIRDFQSQVDSCKSTIASLNNSVSSLSSLKAKLQQNLTETQDNTINEYKKEINTINENANQRVSKIKAQYAQLTESNKEKTQQALSSYNDALGSAKAALRDQLSNLIDRVNHFQNSIDSTASAFRDNADMLGNATAELEKAYGSASPFPRPSYFGRMLATTGLKKANPSWETIKDQIQQMRESVKDLEAVSSQLDKSKLNAQEIIKSNQDGDNWFWGLFS